MDTPHQRNRRELEVDRYPHLATEIVRRDPAFCQQMADMWQVSVIDPLTQRMIPAEPARCIRNLRALGTVVIQRELGKFGHSQIHE